MGFAEFSLKNWDQCRLSSALIELTYRCNLDCSFCYNDVGRRGEPLSLSDYQVLLRGLADLNTLSVTFSGGEPTAHPHFFQIGACAKELGFVIRIKSNGHALRQKMAARIKEQIDPYIIDISLHGACAATHDRLTRVHGSFDRLMENLRVLRDTGLRLQLNTPLTCLNAEEVPAMFDLADDLGVELKIYPSLSPRDNGDRSPLALSITAAQRKKVDNFLKQRAANRAAGAANTRHSSRRYSSKPAPSAGKMNCGAGTSSLVVDPFGNVVACVEWRYPLGSIYEQSIQEIWAGSPQLKAVRQLNAKARETRDSIRTTHGPVSFCPGLALRLTGNPTTPYPGLVD